MKTALTEKLFELGWQTKSSPMHFDHPKIEKTELFFETSSQLLFLVEKEVREEWYCPDVKDLMDCMARNNLLSY